MQKDKWTLYRWRKPTHWEQGKEQQILIYWLVPQKPGIEGVCLLSEDPLVSSTVRRAGGHSRGLADVVIWKLIYHGLDCVQGPCPFCKLLALCS